MDAARKNNDCYFYYYSTCLKGDGCLFRHEPSALGCETVCTYWQQGKCLNQHCNFRHMELRKNRKLIPCYWENQPGGCRKPHCPFMHEKPRDTVGTIIDKGNKEAPGEASTGYSNSDRLGGIVSAANEADATSLGAGRGRRPVIPLQQQQPGSGSESVAGYGSPPVDPLVVNFEEESDNESVPTTTPTKMPQRKVHVKTLEEIRLERIQAESAAFYGYKDDGGGSMARAIADLRAKLSRRTDAASDPATFRVLTLEEIRRSRRAEVTEEETVSGEAGSKDTQPKRATDIESDAPPPKKLKRKAPPRAPPDVITESGVVKLKRHRDSAVVGLTDFLMMDCTLKKEVKANGVTSGVSQDESATLSLGNETTLEEEDELLGTDEEVDGSGTMNDMSADEDVLDDIDDLLNV